MRNVKRFQWGLGLALGLMAGVVLSQETGKKKSSYAPVVIEKDFATIMAEMKAAKPDLVKRHLALLEERYILTNQPARGLTMFGGKPIQTGVRAKLPSGATWDSLAQAAPEEIREKNLFPSGFLALPHPNHPEGGMVFPKFHIDELKKQEGRD